MAKYIPNLLDCLWEIDTQNISSNRGKLADLGIIYPEDFSKVNFVKLLEAGLTNEQIDRINQYLTHNHLKEIKGYTPNNLVCVNFNY